MLLLAVAMPTGLGYAVVGARRLYAAREAARDPWPSGRPVERISSDVRRLHVQLDEIENAPDDLPAKNHRCRATRAAYIDALSAACRQLEIVAPTGWPVTDSEIYRVEAELRRCGLDVRPVA